MLILLILSLLLFGRDSACSGGPGISLGTIVLILLIWWLLVGFGSMPHVRF